MILNTLLTKIFGTTHEREVKRILPLVEAINALAGSVEGLDDAGLTAKTAEFRERLAGGATLDDILVEAFAVCREAADRRLGMLQVYRDVNHTAHAVKCSKHMPFARATGQAADRQRAGCNRRFFGCLLGHTCLTQRAHQHYTCHLTAVDGGSGSTLGGCNARRRDA